MHDAPPPSSAAATPEEDGPFPPRTVLVVDDNPMKRYTTAHALRHAGFAVAEAATGAEALRLARRQPALIVLDVNLPDIGGFEVCRRVKADPETATVLVLHLSGHLTSGEDVAQGLEGGADGYLVVPVEPRVLTANVRALLRLHAAEEAARFAARYWEATFEAIRDGVFLVDAAGAVVRWNAAADTLLRGSGDAPLAVGTPLADVLARLGAVDAPQAHGTRAEAEVEVPGGQWLRITVDPVEAEEPGSAGSGAAGGSAPPRGAVCTVADVTARARAAVKNERIADALQRSLLFRPDIRRFPGLEVEGVYRAASEEALVGGDFADAYALANGRVALVVGDVTGKGLPAATFTAEIKYALRAFLRESPDTALALGRLNRYLMESRRLSGGPEGSYVSLALAVVDSDAGVVAASAAGAEPPLIVRPTEMAAGEAAAAPPLDVTEIAALGPLLAADPESEYGVVSAPLLPGAVLVLATDGLTEARVGRGREFFGVEGLARAVSRGAALGPSLRDAAEAVVAEALAFAGGRQNDDVCLLLARRAAAGAAAADPAAGAEGSGAHAPN